MRFASIAVLILAGCSQTQSAPQPSGPPGYTAAAPTAAAPTASGPAASAVYTCPDGFRFSVRTRGDSVLVKFPAQILTLPRVPSASGEKYQAGDALFWRKGDEARLETVAGKYESCRGTPAPTPWDEARLLGVEFRAIGQEPGWVLDIHQGHSIDYTGDYGSTRIIVPAPEPTRDSVTGTVTYRAQSEGHAVDVIIREAPCADVMSGEEFTHSVAVRVDQREVKGCGRTLATGDVTGIYWKLVELDGRPALATAAPQEAHLRISDDGSTVTGSTGCNGFRGPAQRSGERVKIGPVASTLMACVDPELGSQEQRFLRALESADRLVAKGDELTLYAGERVVGRFKAMYLR